MNGPDVPKKHRNVDAEPWFDDSAMGPELLAPEQNMFLAEARSELECRLHGFRLAHSLLVERTAAHLAQVYGIDLFKARAAGLLHDWSKQLSDEELIARAKAETSFAFPPGCDQEVAGLLHAHIGAIDVGREFPELTADVLQAIDRHTLGASDMTPLDIVIYVADMLEPSRVYEEFDAIRAIVGTASLNEVYLECYANTMQSLFARRRYVVPQGVTIWNEMMDQERDAH